MQPSFAAASMQPRLAATTSSSGASEIRPATGSASSARTPRSSTTTTPPPISVRRPIARAMSWSSMPTTTMLCASWAKVEASAPDCEIEPAHEPDGHPARAEVALDHGDLREAVPGDRVAVLDERLLDERLGHDLVRDHADHARRPALPGDREVAGGDVADADGVLDPLGHLGPLDLADGRPRLSTVSGTNDSRSGSSSRSAW